MVKVLCIFLCLFVLLSDLCSGLRPEDHTQQHGGFFYTRNELLQLRPPPYPPSSRPLMPTVNTTQDASKKRKRGRRGGVKNRLRRRPAKPPLPSVVFANVQSLYNKIDELHAKCQYDNVYREACVMAFCETWLDSTHPDDDIILDGFTVYRSDRTKESGKTRGGGLCIYINNRWCSNVKIHTTLCSPNLELLTLSVRPFYLPREFSNIVLCCVYVPPSADALAAADTIASYMQSMLLRYLDAPVFVMGDFNSCTLDTALPSFHQYVHVPTRNNKTIDLCYGNIPSAYSASAHPPLGRADHNVINLIPAYRQLLKRVKPTRSRFDNGLRMPPCSSRDLWLAQIGVCLHLIP